MEYFQVLLFLKLAVVVKVSKNNILLQPALAMIETG